MNAADDLSGGDGTNSGGSPRLRIVIDARGVPYYWIGFKRGRSDPPEGTDLNAIYRKWISVTPLHLNLTEFHECDRLRKMLGEEHRTA